MLIEWILVAGCAIAAGLLLARLRWSQRSRAFGGLGPGTGHGASKQAGTHAKGDFPNLGAEQALALTSGNR